MATPQNGWLDKTIHERYTSFNFHLRTGHPDAWQLSQEGWLYLATVIDLHNREVAGHAMAAHMRTDLVIAAIDLAFKRGPTRQNAIFHYDRESQTPLPTSVGNSRLAICGHRMGRTGSCFENRAGAESFFATLKTEIGTKVWPTPPRRP